MPFSPEMVELLLNADEEFGRFEVTYLFQSAGEFDLFIEVYCKDREHFVNFLNNNLQIIPGVRVTQSHMILKMYKLSYRWGDAPPLKDREKQSTLPIAEGK